MTEPKHRILDVPSRARIGKAIQLPLSKAIEISVKSLRVRFWRSMLTVSSIILAIAFLTYVWSSSRLQSAVAIGLRADSVRVNEVSQAVDAAWRPFEKELTKRFDKRRADYKTEVAMLFAGGTARFKSFCAGVESDPTNPVDLKDLPEDAKALGPLEAKALEIGLEPDLEGWSRPALRIAGIKGVVQSEVARMGALQLALQRHNVDPAAPVEKLKAMPASAVWLIIISLLVCGVGISNAMLMSVTERFREIGTMKCLGALDTFIIKLFLLESTFQGVAGTAFGVVIGFIIMLLSSLMTYESAVFTYFPWGQMVLILVSSLLIGSLLSVLAAVFPALRAAQMAPVEAMRVEE